MLACAARIPELLNGVGVVSGIGPLDAAGVTERMRITNRIAFKPFRLPDVMWPFLWLLSQTIRLLPGRPEVPKSPIGPEGTTPRAQPPDAVLGLHITDIPIQVHLWHGEQVLNSRSVCSRPI